jgi:predicted RNase H-like HicB family nuclease
MGSLGVAHMPKVRSPADRQDVRQFAGTEVPSLWWRSSMHNEFTAILERDGDWYVAYCPEIPGANGQGQTKEEARKSLADAIALILEDRREDMLRGVPPEAERDTVVIE